MSNPDITKQKSSIRTWALAAVAVTSAFIIGISIWLIFILSAPDWCNRAVGAAKYADGRPESAINGCFTLLRQQVDALALNSHMAIGVMALCLATLMIIVLAGGRVSFKAGKDGVSGEFAKDKENENDPVV